MVSQFKWYANNCQSTKDGLERWYAGRKIRLINGKQQVMMLHRFILQNFDMSIEADHIDGNGLNNQKSNLRLCTHQENGRNGRKRNNTSSKYKGVYWNKKEKKWMARTCYSEKGKVIVKYLGSYTNEQEGALAYNKKAIELFGEYAKLNEVI